LGIKTYDFSGFRKAKNEGYNVTVPNSVTSVEVYYSKADSKSSVSVTGNKNLVEGTNIVKVTVTAEDGTKNTYKIHITRKTAEDIEETTPNVIDETPTPEELYLIALSVGNLKLSPTFDKTKFEYLAELKEDLTELEVLATANSKTASVTIEGNKDLKDGENKIIVTITSEDGTNKVTYTILVNKNIPKTPDIALLVSAFENLPPFPGNPFEGLNEIIHKQYICKLIIFGTIVYLGIFIIYILINERKFIGKKQGSFTKKYQGSRFK